MIVGIIAVITKIPNTILPEQRQLRYLGFLLSFTLANLFG